MMTELNARDIASQKVKLFERQFGSEYRLLAYHAALPLVLTPELLHYLRTEFLLNNQEIGWEAEADLLLSDLCAQVGYELYAMDSDVRSYLLQEMPSDSRIPEDRMFKVARVLISYVAYLSRINPGQRQQELQAQKWAAMTYLGEAECRQAVEEIVTAFTESSDRGNSNAVKAEFARLARITEKLVEKLGDNHPLVKFAQDVNRSIKDPTVNIRREYTIGDRQVNIPWLPIEVEPKIDRADEPFPELTSFEFDVAEFVDPLEIREEVFNFEVATLTVSRWEIDDLLKSANEVIKSRTKAELTGLQYEILAGTWNNLRYAEIAESERLSLGYVSKVGAELFRMLSEEMGQSISKTNMVEVFRRSEIQINQSPAQAYQFVELLGDSRSVRETSVFAERLSQRLVLEMVKIPAGSFMMGAPESETGSSDKGRC